MGLTFAVLFAVELTIANTKSGALFFAMCVLGVGYALRAYSHKLSGLKTMTVSRGVADMVTPELSTESMRPRLEEGQKIMVAARGITPVLGFALEEAQLRKASPLRALREGDRGLFLRRADHRRRRRDGRMIPRRTPSCR